MDKKEKQLVKEIKNYKIPQDWHKFKMGKLFNFSGGLSFSRNNLSDIGFLYLHYGNIHTSRKNYINVKNEINVLPKLNIPLNDVKEESLLKHGDVVFVDASEDYEGTSKCVVIENSENIPFISGLHTIVAKSNGEIIRNGYKKYCFENWDIKRQFAFFVTGISVFGLNKTNISRIIIPVPSLLEQQIIAEILSTCDKVIELKEKLIEQKKLQKKYLMQVLLDPKSPNFRRLPGFDKDWEEVELGSLGEFKTSSVDKKDYENQETVELLNYMDVYRNPIIDNSLKLKKVTASIKQIKTFGLGYGDILFTPSSETPDDIGHSAVFKRYKGTVLYSYHLVRMKLIKKMDIDFRGYIFNVNYLLNEFSKRATGATRYTLSLKDFKEVFIKLPKDIEEQTAIAKILSMVDQEVEFLEKELEQQKLKKKALMQLLLTGKVRVNVS